MKLKLLTILSLYTMALHAQDTVQQTKTYDDCFLEEDAIFSTKTINYHITNILHEISNDALRTVDKREELPYFIFKAESMLEALKNQANMLHILQKESTNLPL